MDAGFVTSKKQTAIIHVIFSLGLKAQPTLFESAEF